MQISRAAHVAVMIALIAVGATTAQAEVVRIEVTSREDVLNGKPFGTVGPYERIQGKVFFAVDPTNPRNKVIPALDKAPRTPKGLVEFSADIFIYAPKDAAKGNGVAFFEVPNRGRRDQLIRFARAPRGAGATPDAEFGDGFLLQNGYTLVWIGWQFSLARNGALIGIDLPVAMENGQPMTGRVTAPFLINMASDTLALDPDTARYAPVDLNSPDAQLSVKQNVYDTPRVIPRDQWQFAKMDNGQVVPDPASLYLKAGFELGQTYELSYQAKGPVVGGLGYAALRDVASAFKHQKGALPSARYTYLIGESQTGRFVREFIYEGFNADEQGRKSFDAIWAHIAGAARADFIQPFSLPNGAGAYTGTMFPYTDTPQRDPVTGKTDSMLTKMSKDVIPRIVYTNTDWEYWGVGRSAPLTYTTLDGTKDLPPPDNVRIYHVAGTQHLVAPFPPVQGAAQSRPNPNDYTWALRAILVSLDNWVRQGTAPLPSSYPKLSDGTLVAHAALKFPAIPGVQSPSIISGPYRADLGGPSSPKLPFLVPQVDADGNDLGGIRLPDLAVPLATYTGWSFRNPKTGAPTEMVQNTGAFLPFPKTRAEREQSRDPRLSIEERYPSRDAYLSKVREAAEKLAREGYVLKQDVEPLVARGGEVWDHVTSGATQKTN